VFFFFFAIYGAGCKFVMQGVLSFSMSFSNGCGFGSLLCENFCHVIRIGILKNDGFWIF